MKKLVNNVSERIILFSCCNDKAVMIAESILKNDENVKICFFECDRKPFENAVIFTTAIGDGYADFCGNDCEIYLCKDNEYDNISDGEKIIEMGNKGDIVLFSREENLDGIDKNAFKIRFVDEIRYAVLKYLCEHSVFKLADENNHINIAFNGLNETNKELIKALVWVSQRKGYRLYICVNASSEQWLDFCKDYPEIINTQNLSDSDEISYQVVLGENSYINSKEILISDEEFMSIYNENVLKNKTVERIAERIFGYWSEGKADFWLKEYDYKTSTSSAMFWLMRKRDGESIEICEENMRLEHKRWNAFMRSLGYSFGEVRDDNKKWHPCLVGFDELLESDKLLDANPIKSVLCE